ncbi:uncharacterized protein LOC134577932 [Pelobates fuscus]|uniref:uncharacterized protein LOC134577932 n=1 Tax=Pelobates fuscus TaxID=191477 RepID=UPI002FE4314D
MNGDTDPTMLDEPGSVQLGQDIESSQWEGKNYQGGTNKLEAKSENMKRKTTTLAEPVRNMGGAKESMLGESKSMHGDSESLPDIDGQDEGATVKCMNPKSKTMQEEVDKKLGGPKRIHRDTECLQQVAKNMEERTVVLGGETKSMHEIGDCTLDGAKRVWGDCECLQSVERKAESRYGKRESFQNIVEESKTLAKEDKNMEEEVDRMLSGPNSMLRDTECFQGVAKNMEERAEAMGEETKSIYEKGEFMLGGPKKVPKDCECCQVVTENVERKDESMCGEWNRLQGGTKCLKTESVNILCESETLVEETKNKEVKVDEMLGGPKHIDRNTESLHGETVNMLDNLKISTEDTKNTKETVDRMLGEPKIMLTDSLYGVDESLNKKTNNLAENVSKMEEEVIRILGEPNSIPGDTESFKRITGNIVEKSKTLKNMEGKVDRMLGGPKSMDRDTECLQQVAKNMKERTEALGGETKNMYENVDCILGGPKDFECCQVVTENVERKDESMCEEGGRFQGGTKCLKTECDNILWESEILREEAKNKEVKVDGMLGEPKYIDENTECLQVVTESNVEKIKILAKDGKNIKEVVDRMLGEPKIMLTDTESLYGVDESMVDKIKTLAEEAKNIDDKARRIVGGPKCIQGDLKCVHWVAQDMDEEHEIKSTFDYNDRILGGPNSMHRDTERLHGLALSVEGKLECMHRGTSDVGYESENINIETTILGEVAKIMDKTTNCMLSKPKSMQSSTNSLPGQFESVEEENESKFEEGRSLKQGPKDVETERERRKWQTENKAEETKYLDKITESSQKEVKSLLEGSTCKPSHNSVKHEIGQESAPRREKRRKKKKRPNTDCETFPTSQSKSPTLPAIHKGHVIWLVLALCLCGVFPSVTANDTQMPNSKGPSLIYQFCSKLVNLSDEIMVIRNSKLEEICTLARTFQRCGKKYPHFNFTFRDSCVYMNTTDQVSVNYTMEYGHRKIIQSVLVDEPIQPEMKLVGPIGNTTDGDQTDVRFPGWAIALWVIIPLAVFSIILIYCYCLKRKRGHVQLNICCVRYTSVNIPGNPEDHPVEGNGLQTISEENLPLSQTHHGAKSPDNSIAITSGTPMLGRHSRERDRSS